VTAQAQYAAVLAAVDAACSKPVYGYDNVPGTNNNPGTTPAAYLLQTVERRFAPADRLSAQSAVTGWRITVRAVGADANSVRVSLSQAAAALNEAVLTVGGKQTTPVQHESSLPAEWDDGSYSGLDTYTYSH
jgi:hypothetical protein